MLKPDLFQTWSKGLPMPGFLLFLTSYPDDLWLHTDTPTTHKLLYYDWMLFLNVLFMLSVCMTVKSY